MKNTAFDFIILGAGITGLAIAREIRAQFQDASILILEKESYLGAHGSGRNSGVLHSGIYYPEQSLKAAVCSEGAKLMSAYCHENSLAINKIGKVIVPTKQEDDFQLDLLLSRAKTNGANANILDQHQLNEIEPFARSASERALYVPDTAVVDPKSILKNLHEELITNKVTIQFSNPCVDACPEKSSLHTKKGSVNYVYLVNATGQFSDQVAHKFEVGKKYTLLPFKGVYYRLSNNSCVSLSHLVYPVPDLNVPFLGVHSVNTINGETYLGPTAIPAFGRAHYRGLDGFQINEAAKISYYLLVQYLRNRQGFRKFANEEAGRIRKKKFVQAVQAIIPDIQHSDLLASDKVGIRAQLFDKSKHELVMDFIVEERANTIHVLNAISPAFTSAFSFAKYVVNQIKI